MPDASCKSCDRLHWGRLTAALLAGALLPLAFSPFGFYPLAFISVAVLFFLWAGQSQKPAFWIGYAYGLGQFGFGVSWLYASFTLFGEAIAPVAALITAAFVAVVALYPALAGLLVARLARRQASVALLVAPFAWVLVEWLRGWLFGGFPWLNLGASQTDSPLGGVIPVLGEYGASLWVAALAATLAWAGWKSFVARFHYRRLLLPIAVLLMSFGSGQALKDIDWVESNGEPLHIGMAQGNIPQMRKFDPDFLLLTLQRYMALTDQMPDVDLVIWPETAIPDLIEDLPRFRETLEQTARQRGFVMLVGAFDQDEAGRYFNTMQGIPESLGRYAKRHLVPFGEYLPLRGALEVFRGLIDIPMADLSPGPIEQALPKINGHAAGVSICYEAALSREIRRALPEAGFLVNASNDSWFGDSFAPYQHLQIARVRTIEFARPMARATNTGVSALIDHQGRIIKNTALNEIAWVVGELQPMQGQTPFTRWGQWPVLTLALLGLLLGGLWSSRLCKEG